MTGDDQVECGPDMPYHYVGPFYQETNMKKTLVTIQTISQYNKQTVLQRKEMKLE